MMVLENEPRPAGKLYRLTRPDGNTYESPEAGALGGNRNLKIYGRLNCRSATNALPRGYAQHRVFFADETTAIAAGYRPCGNCLREVYRQWAQGGEPGSTEFPWLIGPSKPKLNE